MSESVKRSKGVTAYRRLRRLIQAGEVDVDQRLTEAKACELTGMTRGPVREALLKLEGDGLLSSGGHSCSRVVRYLEDQSRQDLINRYELRECIEAKVVRLAAKNMTGSQVDELRRIARQVDEAWRAGDTQLAYDLHFEFFEYLVDHCGNPLMAEIWWDYNLTPPQPRSATMDAEIRRNVSADQQRRWSTMALAEAIHAHDADRAEQIVHEKVANVIDLLRTTRWEDGSDPKAQPSRTDNAPRYEAEGSPGRDPEPAGAAPALRSSD